MALPLGHAAAGYLAYEAVRPAGRHRPRWLAAALVLANAPDLDYVPGFLVGHPDTWHRGGTHSLVAALAVAAVAVALAGARRLPWRLALGGALAWASHLLLDFVTANAAPPRGIPLLWPLTARTFIAAHPLLGEIVVDASGRGAFLRSLLDAGAARIWLEQGALLVCAVAGVHAVRALAAALVTPVGGVARDDG
ncbi:MAG TPA: metal-dependent hydrolase [Candidatus Binatia bacterium]|nr:metal-dependent hydrolase [Candidatus Binatia bacterium]